MLAIALNGLPAEEVDPISNGHLNSVYFVTPRTVRGVLRKMEKKRGL
jgi:hypothetical protein